jgi:aminoglycoside 2''-phosphotransferase
MDKQSAVNQINLEYPDFFIEKIEFLGSGFDSEAFLINQIYVFKFPRHQKAAKNLYKEALILKEIKGQVPLKVPDICLVGESDALNELQFVGYEKIEGVPLDAEILATLTKERKDKLAKDLAAFFKALHGIDLSITIEGLKVEKKNKAKHEYKVIKENAYPFLKNSVKNQIDKVYQRLLNQEFHDKNCLIHNDFGASNVYYDLSTNEINGVIDFGDSAIYDRDMEFVCLMYDYEEGFDQEFVQKLIDYYGVDSASLINKFNFTGFYNQLENIYLGKEFEMKELLDESIHSIQKGIEGYEENILREDKTKYYL